MTKLRPLGDRVVVERVKPDDKTSGGIVLPDTAKDKPKEGKVLSVGQGKTLDNGTVCPLEVKKGDCVLFGSYSGNEVKIDGKDYLILSESDVFAVIENGLKK